MMQKKRKLTIYGLNKRLKELFGDDAIAKNHVYILARMEEQGKIRAIELKTLGQLCAALHCEINELIEYNPEEEASIPQ